MISLSATEAERRFLKLGIPNRFTTEEKKQFEAAPWNIESGGVIAFPVPHANSGLNILNLRRILGTDPSKQPSFFDHPWYLEERFGQNDCAPGWHCMHMAPAQDSISAPFDYCRSLRDRGMDVPAAVEVALMLFLHYAGTGEQLLEKKHTWCSDRARMNEYVTLGAFGRNGLFVSCHPPQFASRGLGVCAKITR